jgi:hypothetical protein
MPLAHVETKILANAIHVRYADNPDPTRATEWLDAQVTMPNAKMPSGTVLKDPEGHYLAGLRLVALLYARSTADAEIQRLQGILGHMSAESPYR